MRFFVVVSFILVMSSLVEKDTVYHSFLWEYLVCDWMYAFVKELDLSGKFIVGIRKLIFRYGNSYSYHCSDVKYAVYDGFSIICSRMQRKICRDDN